MQSRSKWILSFAAAGFALACLLFLVSLGSSPTAQAAPPEQSGTPIVTPGPLTAVNSKGGVRFRNFNSGGGNEVYIGIPAGLGGPEQRRELGLTWRQPASTPPTNTVTFAYDPATGWISSTINSSSFITYNVGNIAPSNVVRILVWARTAGTTLRFSDVRLNGTLLPTNVFTAAAGSTSTQFRDFTITGPDWATGFRLSGNLTWTGTQSGGENNKLEIGVGFRDFDPPVVRNLNVSPNPGTAGETIVVTAEVDDSLTGNNVITAAEMRIDDGSWLPMAPTDGTFDSPTEAVNSSFLPNAPRTGSVCVRGTDALLNVSEPFCTPYTANPPPVPGIALSQTVSLDPALCGTETDLLAPAGTIAYLCYTVTNTGTAPLTFHFLEDETEGTILDGVFVDLQPGASYNTVQAGQVISTVVTADATRRGTWEAFDERERSASATAEATLRVGAPAITVQKLVATSDTCAGTPSLSAPVGSNLWFCVLVTNSGNFTFTQHTISDPLLGINATLDLPLAPGATATISNDQIPALGPVALVTSLTNRVTVTSTAPESPTPPPPPPPEQQPQVAAIVAPVQASGGATAAVTAETPTSDDPAAEPGSERVFLPLLMGR